MNATAVIDLASEDDVKDDIEGVDSKGNHKKGKMPFLWRDCMVVLARALLPSAGEAFNRTSTTDNLGYSSPIEAAGCAGSDADLAKPPRSLLASSEKMFSGMLLQIYTVDPAGGWRHWGGGGTAVGRNADAVRGAWENIDLALESVGKPSLMQPIPNGQGDWEEALGVAMLYVVEAT